MARIAEKEDPNISHLTETKSKRAPSAQSPQKPRLENLQDSDPIKWTKAVLVGALGSLIMLVFIMLAISAGLAPFNIPPSAAFLEKIGMNIGPLALVIHFGYGAFWSLVLTLLLREKTTLMKGNLMALGLWLVMMLVYSPIIGWGPFGFGNADELASSHPLYLEAGSKYLIVTLVLHLIYGSIIGWLNPLWIKFGKTRPS